MKQGSELINEINSTVDQTAFWWLGQIGFALKMANLTLYIDAYLRDNPARQVPPAFKPVEVTNADYFFGTHDHSDHVDREVWHELSKSSPKAKFIVPSPLIDNLSEQLSISKDRFIGIEDGKTFEVEGLKITGVAAAHEFLDQDPVSGMYPYLGYIIEADNKTIYHSGDSCIYEGLQTKLKQYGKIDVMFLPINGRDASRYKRNCIGNMTYQEAVDLAGSINPGLVVPAHYDMFIGNMENPTNFAEYLDAKYPNVHCWIGDHFTRVIF